MNPRTNCWTCFTLVVALFSTCLASLADETWKGTSDNLWSTTANWSGTAAPLSTDSVIYNGSSTANLSNWLTTTFSIKGILFTNPAGPVSINSASALTVGSGGINLSNATQTLSVSAPLTLGAFQIWGVTNTQALSVSGVISGASGLYKDGLGLLYLSGANTFTGGFTNNGGQVWVNNSAGLGAGPKTVSVANNNVGAGLHLQGTNGNIILPANIAYSLSQQNGAIFNEAGDNVILGNMNVFSGGGYAYLLVNAGTLTLNGNVTLGTTPRAFALGGAGNGTLNGAMSGAGFPFRKVDSGTWTMTNNNTYSGYTTVEGGTLALAPTGKIGSSTNITVFANATLDVSAVTNSAGSNALYLAANQILAGGGIVAGSVATVSSATIQPGSLNTAQAAGGMGVAGTLTISSNFVMSGTVTNYFELNTATTVDSGVNDLISVGGNLDPQNARIFVTALSALTPNTPYRLFNYNGALPSAFNPVVLTDTHYTFSLDQSTAGQINVTASSGPTLLWSASTSSSTWDLNSTANWNNNSLKFLNFDPVAFDDTAATNFVTLTGTLKPVSVTFSNSTLGYTLQGSGKITGPTGLTKWNAGTLIITTTGSDYTGAVTVNGGVLGVSSVAVNGSASSLGAGTNITLNGGTFQFGGTRPAASSFNRYWTLGANGGTVLSTNGALFLMNTISGPGSLTKSGSPQVILGDIVTGVLTNANNNYTGNTYITQGELQIRNARALGFGKAVVSNGADLAVGGGANYGTFTNNIDLNGGDGNGSAGTLQVNDGGTAVTFGGAINLQANSSVGTVNNGNAVGFTIAGPITGPGSLKKLGTNSVVIIGANNNYAGGTTVGSGTLDVRADGGLGSGNVTVASGATLKLGSGTANTYISSGANLLLNAGSPAVNLAFAGTPNSVNALSFDGGASFKATGTWGSPTSGAAHTDSRFTGNGMLNVLTGPASTTTVASSANPAVYGSPVTLNATVSPAGATGSVTFHDGALLLGSATLTSGQAALILNTLAATNSPHSITASYSGDNNFAPSTSVAFQQSITRATLTVTGLSAQNKAYDGLTNATLNLSNAALDGTVGGDTVVLVVTNAVGTFEDPAPGTNKTVFISGLAIYGEDAGNYSLTQPVTTATITPFGLTVTGIEAGDKTYDRTTNATLVLTNAALAGVVPGDDVTLVTTNASGAFVDKNVGSAKTVNVSGLLIVGAAIDNYTLLQPATNASITPVALNVTGVSANSKPYDGTNTATLAGTPALSAGVIGSEDVALGGTPAATFDDKNVGHGKQVTLTGFELAGADIGNYTLSQPTGLTADISRAALSVTGLSAQSKVYDANTSATLLGTPALEGVFGNDDVSVTGTAAGAFADADVGTGKTVTISGLGLTGGDAGSYSLIPPASTADITAAASSTALSSSQNPSTQSSNVTFTAAVSSTAGVPVGEVVFLANGVPFSTNGLVSGVASASTSLLPAGTNTVAAQFAAQGNFQASSDSLQQVVNSAAIYSRTNFILGIADNLNGTFTLSFQGTPQAQYYVEATADLSPATPVWTALSDSTNTAVSPSGLWSYIVSNSNPQQFYRSVAVAPAP